MTKLDKITKILNVVFSINYYSHLFTSIVLFLLQMTTINVH